MTKDETPNDEKMRKAEARSSQLAWCIADFVPGHFRHSLFGIIWSLVVSHWSWVWLRLRITQLAQTNNLALC